MTPRSLSFMISPPHPVYPPLSEADLRAATVDSSAAVPRNDESSPPSALNVEDDSRRVQPRAGERAKSCLGNFAYWFLTFFTAFIVTFALLCLLNLFAW
jgi:hypothetical protein